MIHIEKLIDELCPNGVEFKKLGEFATLDRGNGMPKTMLVDSGVGAIHYGQIYTHYGVSADKTLSFVTNDDASRLTKVHPGDVIITNTSENLEDVATTVVWLGDDDIVIGGHSSVIRHDQDARFLAYWFRSAAFEKQKYRLATGAKVIDISAKKLESVVVPVPPLEVQREIVKVLDLFTKLEAELVARRKQYEYYRDQLLTFPENGEAPWVELGSLFELKAGNHVRASEISRSPVSDDWVACYGGNGLRGFVRECNQPTSRILIGRQGALSGNVHFAEGPFYATEHAIVLTPKNDISERYFLHALVHANLGQYVSQGAQPGLAVGRVKAIAIPLPPLSEQKRIADILDKFDALVNDLESGLPAEIEARRKQYEHYRDKLLTFKELEPSA